MLLTDKPPVSVPCTPVSVMQAPSKNVLPDQGGS